MTQRPTATAAGASLVTEQDPTGQRAAPTYRKQPPRGGSAVRSAAGAAAGVADAQQLQQTLTHQHVWQFLRQETRPSRRGWEDRVLEQEVYDVFFCQTCPGTPEYRWVLVRREEPDTLWGGWRPLWERPPQRTE